MNEPTRSRRDGAKPLTGWFTPVPGRTAPEAGAVGGAPSEPIVALNFRVPAGFRRAFRIAAACEGITLSALLRRIFAEWQASDGRG